MHTYDGDDIYCDLIIPRRIEINIVEETDNILAFYHTKPYWPVHIVVTPKSHVISLLELEAPLSNELLEVVKRVAVRVKNDEGSVRVLTNLGNYQDSKHLHFHVAYGEKLQ